MSMCDYHVISRISGFGRLDVLLSNHWHNVFEIHKQNCSCTIDDHDTLERFNTLTLTLFLVIHKYIKINL
jgi:hypothetical protein